MDLTHNNSQLLDMAIAGDKEAQISLAYRYEHGINLTTCLAKAYAWAYVAEPLARNPYLRKLSNKLNTPQEINAARVFAIKLERIINQKNTG